MRPRLLWPRWFHTGTPSNHPFRGFNEAEAFVASVALDNLNDVRANLVLQ